MATVSLQVIIPVANPVKFTQDNVDVTQRANFDQRRYSSSRNASNKIESRYPQLWEKTDLIRVQVHTNYTIVRLRIVDCAGDSYDPTIGIKDNSKYYTPSIAKQYKNLKYRADCMFASVDGKLFIYFAEGLEYSDEAFTISGDLVVWDGTLPNINAEVGDFLRYKIGTNPFASAQITEIKWNVSLQAEGYLTDIDYALGDSVSGVVEVTYDEKETNLYSQEVNLSNLVDGEYFLRLEFGTTSIVKTYTTEPMDVQQEHPDTQAIEYCHKGTFDEPDAFTYEYLANWTNVIRMAADFFRFKPTGEITQDVNDNGVPRNTRAVPFRQLTFDAFNIPSWLADKLAVIFSHDTKKITGYYWENENLGSPEEIKTMDLNQFSIELKQVNDRTVKEDIFTDDLTASFTPPSDNDVAFAGEVLPFTFNTNTGLPFHFLSLPDWITADVDTFEDGDVVTLTIAANAGVDFRSIVLLAINNSFTEVTAQLSFTQLFDESLPPAPKFLTTDITTVELAGTNGYTKNVYVSASGDYTATTQSGFAFTLTKFPSVYDPNVLNVTEFKTPSINNTGINRTAVVRLALIADPSVYVDINVVQYQQISMVSLSSYNLMIGAAGGNQTVDVTVLTGTQWQAVSGNDDPDPNAWISFSTTVKTGNLTFGIHFDALPEFMSNRFGSITFINVNNPFDYLTLSLTQSAT